MAEALPASIFTFTGAKPRYLLLRAWPETKSVLVESGTAFTVAPGLAMRDMPCAHCSQPLQGIPYTLFTLIASVPCPSSGNHIPSVTVPIHVTCDDGNDQAISDKIVSLFADCGD